MSHPKVFLFIQSGRAEHYAQRRQWCRETWLSDAHLFPNLTYRFITGGWEGSDEHGPLVDGDTLHFRCRDGKNGCSDKHLWAVDTFLVNHEDAQIMVKADDDTYIHLPRLMANESLRRYEYGGYLIPISVEEAGGGDIVRGGYISGGGSVWYSRRACEFIADELERGHYNDDQLIGHILKRNGIEPHNDSRFHSWYDADLDTPIPLPTNDHITTHNIRSRELMHEIHKRRMGQ